MIRTSKGQTLVEVALVLPLFGLGIFTAVQLICYAHNFVELQSVASLQADRWEIGRIPAGRRYHLFVHPWGRTTPVSVATSRDASMPWVPARGTSVLREPGLVIRTQADTRLLPSRGFIRRLPIVLESATADTLIEPAVPEER